MNPLDRVLAMREAAQTRAIESPPKQQLVANAAQDKVALLDIASNAKKEAARFRGLRTAIDESILRNSDRSVGEHLQDAGSLSARALLGVGQVAYGTADLLTELQPQRLGDRLKNFASGDGFQTDVGFTLDEVTGNIDEALGGTGETLSEKFQRTREIIHETESAPLTARRGEISNRAQQRAADNIEFDKTNPNIFQDAYKGIENFGSGLADLGEFGTVALDAAIESIPQSLVPGGITTKISTAAAKKEALEKTKKFLRTKDGRKKIIDDLGPKKAEFKVGKSDYSIENGVVTNLTSGNKLVKPSGKVKKLADKKLGAAQKKFRKSPEGKKAVVDLTDEIASKDAAKFLASKEGRGKINKLASKTGLAYTVVAEGVSNAVDVKATILRTSEKDLNESSEEYRKLRKAGKSHEVARRTIANKARDITAAIAGLLGGVAGKLTGASKLEGLGFKADTKLGNSLASKVSRAIPTPIKAALKEGVEETSQGATGQLAGNIAESFTSDDSKELLEGVVDSAASGAVAGSLSGGGISTVANLGKTGQVIEQGKKKAAEVASTIGLNKEVKAAIKAKDITEITNPKSKNYKAENAATALLHESQIPNTPEEIAEHVAKVQPHLDTIDAQLKATRPQAIEDAQAAKDNSDAYGTIENPTAKEKARNRELIDKAVKSTNAQNELQSTFDKLKEQVSLIEDSSSVSQAVETKDALNKFNAVQQEGNAEIDSDLSTDSNVDGVDTELQEAVTAAEAKLILGTSAFDASESNLDSIESIDGLDESSKKQIKLLRTLNTGEVSKEIRAKQRGDGKKGLREHLQALKASPTNENLIKGYNRFKEGIVAKLDYYPILQAGLTNKTIRNSEEYGKALAIFESKVGKLQGGVAIRNNKAFFNKTIPQLESDKIAFDLADEVLTGFGVDSQVINASPVASTVATSPPGDGVEGDSQGTVTTETKTQTEQSRDIANETGDSLDAAVAELGENVEELGKVVADTSDKRVTTKEEAAPELEHAKQLNTLLDLQSKGGNTEGTSLVKFIKDLGHTVKAAYRNNPQHRKSIVALRKQARSIVDSAIAVDNVAPIPIPTDDANISQTKRTEALKSLESSTFEKVKSSLNDVASGFGKISHANLITALKNNEDLTVPQQAIVDAINEQLNTTVEQSSEATESDSSVVAKDVVQEEATNTLEPTEPQLIPEGEKGFFEKLLGSKLINKKAHATLKEFPEILKPLKEFFSFNKGAILDRHDNLFKDTPNNRASFNQATADQLGFKQFTDLTDEQQVASRNTFDYVNGFIKTYKNTFIDKEFSDNNLTFLHTNPLDYFLREYQDADGRTKYQMPANVIAALALSSLEFLNNQAEELAYPDPKRMESLLGEREYGTNTNKLFKYNGILDSTLENSLGKSFANAMNMQDKNTTPINQSAKMNVAAGKRILNMLELMDLVEINKVPTAFLELARSNSTEDHTTLEEQIVSENYNDFDFKNSDGIEGKVSSSFIKPRTIRTEGKLALAPQVARLAGMFNNTESMGHKLFGMTTVDTFPIFNLPNKIQEFVKRGLSKVPKKAAKISLEASQNGIQLSTPMRKILTSIGQDNLAKLLVTPMESRVFPQSHKISEQSQVDQMVRSMDAYFDFLEQFDEDDKDFAKEFYLNNTNWTNGRVGVGQNNMDWQGNKFARHVMQYTANQIEIDPSKTNETLGFQLAVMQALGVDVDKSTTADIKARFDALVIEANDTSSALHTQINTLSAIVDGENVTPEILTILEDVLERDGEEPLHKMNGLIGLSQFIVGKPFKTDLFYEVDGITNGFAITLLQMFTDGVPVPPNRLPELINNQVIQAISDKALQPKLKAYREANGLKLKEFNKKHIDAYLTDPSTVAYLHDDIRKLFKDEINDVMFKERLEKTGVFSQDTDITNYGQFINQKGAQDSYKDLTNSQLQNAETFREQLSNEQTFTDISHLVRAIYHNSTFKISGSPDSINKVAKKKALNKISKFGLQKSIEKIQAGKQGHLKETLSRLSEIDNTTISHIGSMILNNISTKEINQDKKVGVNPAKANARFHARMINMFESAEALNGTLYDEKDIDGAGVLQFAVNSDGRKLAKPSLLISNYGSSIKNIIRTYAVNAVEAMEYNLAKLKAKNSSSISDEEKASVQVEIDAITTNINNLLVGKAGIGAVSINVDNADNVLTPKSRAALVEALADSYGQIIGNTLEERYGDMFASRKQLNNITHLTYELFTRYKDAFTEKYLKDNGLTILTREHQDKITEALVDVIPYYKTFFSEALDEGVYGPVSKEVQQRIRTKDDNGNEQVKNDPEYTVNVESYEKDGSSTKRASAGILREDAHPGVRINVMLTHALDAAVQQLLMDKLKAKDPFLNVHDAAAFKAIHPKAYMEAYNAAYIEVMTSYSLPTAILEPLNRVMAAVKANHPEVLTTLAKDFNDPKVKVAMGESLLGPGSQEATPTEIFEVAQNVVSKMNSKKAEFFANNTLDVTQYSIGDFDGATVSPADIETAGGIDRLHKTINSTETEIPNDEEFGTSVGNSININKFTANKTLTLNPANVLAEFDKMFNGGTKVDSASHTKVLRDMIKGTIQDVLGDIQLNIRNQGDTTEGVYNPEKGIFLNIPTPGTTAPNFSASMSSQEAYTHELTHSVIRKALDSVPELLNRAVRLRKEALASGNFTPVMFMDPNSTAVKGDPIYDSEYAIAEERFDYVFKNSEQHTIPVRNPQTGKIVNKKVENGIHEFMTFAVTNEAFITQLNKTTITNSLNTKNATTLFEKATELFNKIINIFRTRVLKKPISGDVAARELFNDLATAHITNVEKFAAITAALNTLGKVYSNSVGLAYNGVTILASPLANLVGLKIRKNGKPKKFTEENAESVGVSARVVTSALGAEHDGLIKSLLHEMSPRSRLNNFVHTALRVKNKNIDKAIQKIASNITRYLNNQFDNNLSNQEKVTITKGILRNDIQSVSDHYSTSTLADIFGKDKVRNKEIRDLNNKIRNDYAAHADFYIIMAKNLGRFMVTGGHRGKAMHLNAHNIAQLKESGLTPVGDLTQATIDIDRLATLYSINDSNLHTRNETARLLREHPDAMDKVIKINKLNTEERLLKLFDNNPAQMIKGYIRESYSKHIKFRVGDLADEESMKREGYHLESNNKKSIAKDSSDNSGPKYLYVNRYADISERQSGAFSLIDNHAKGAFVDQKHLAAMMKDKSDAFKKAAAGIDEVLAPLENAATPIVDSNGNVTNYRYTMNNATKESLLEADLAFDTVLARLETHTIAKIRSPRVNKTLIESALDTFNKVPAKARHKYFIAIGPNEKGKFKEYWDLLPEQTKQDVFAVWGQDKLYLPIDGIVMAMGQPKWSTQSVNKVSLTNKKGVSRALASLNNNIAVPLLNNPKAHLFDSLLREGVGFVKDVIVVKTGTVLLGNQVSNMITLKVKGVSIKNIIVDEARAIKHAKAYAVIADQIMQHRIDLRTNSNLSAGDRKNIRADIASLNGQLTLNPVAELMDAGIHQTIVEDVDDIEDSPGNQGRIEKAIRNNFIVNMLVSATKDNPYAKGIKTVGSELLMTHDSAVYKFLKEGTQLSDFAARFVLHEHNKKKGMSVEKSIAEIEDTFINYDLPTHPFLQAGNDLGFMLFTKFFFRIQPVIIDMLVKNPDNVLALLLSQMLFGVNPEDVFESIMTPGNLINKFNNPVDLLDEILDGPLIADAILN